MGCYLCGGKGVIRQQKGREICAKCFCRLIEKRIRKYSRINKCFSNKDRILVIGDLSRYFVENIVGKRPVKLFFRAKEDESFIKKNKINKIAPNQTLDDEVNSFLEDVFNKKKRKIEKKHISLLANITDKEAKLFAKLRKIKFKPNKKNKDIMKLLKELTKKHTHAKFSLMKNIRNLGKLAQSSSVK